MRLPYSPEAEPRFGRQPGAEVMAAIARDSGGAVRRDLLDVFDNPPSPGTLVEAAPLLLILALVLALGEILVRRLQLTLFRIRTVRAAPASDQVSVTAPSPSPSAETPVVVAVPSDPSGVPPPDDGLHEALRQLRKRR